MQDSEDSPWFFLFGDRVDAPSRNPKALLGGNFYYSREGGKGRARTNVLAFQGGNVRVYQQPAFAFVQEDQRPSVFRARRRPVELNRGVQTILSVVCYCLLYVGLR